MASAALAVEEAASAAVDLAVVASLALVRGLPVEAVFSREEFTPMSAALYAAQVQNPNQNPTPNPSHEEKR